MDKEKVIRAVSSCFDYWLEQHKCLLPLELEHVRQLKADALALLKEQEAVEPIPPTDESDLWKCGNCNHQLFRCTHQRYCEECGKAVKWNEIN